MPPADRPAPSSRARGRASTLRLRRDVEDAFELPGFVSNLLRMSWWALALRGLLACALGIFALLRPQTTLAALLVVLGAYLIADGVFALITGLRAARAEERYWPLLFEGAVSLGVGVLAFARPLAFAVGVFVMVALRCIIAGSVEIAAGSALRSETGVKDWTLWCAGGASLLVGVLLLLSPAAGVTSLIGLGALYGLSFGAALIASAFRVRSLMA